MKTMIDILRNWGGLLWILLALFYWWHDDSNMAIMMILFYEMEDFLDRKQKQLNTKGE